MNTSLENTPIHQKFIEDQKKAKRDWPTNYITPCLTAALEISKVSDRNAAYIIAATAESLGKYTADLAVNKELIRRSRHKHHKAASEENQASFNPTCQLTVNWDEKMVPALMSKKLIDRLALLVSRNVTMKL